MNPTATQASSAGEDIPRETVDSPHSNHDSTPNFGEYSYERVANSLSKDILSSPVSPSPLKTSSVLALPSPILVHTLSVEIVPSLASLLPEDNTRILSEFSDRHVGFLLPEGNYPSTFPRLVYTLFADFPRFVHSHPVVELLSAHKGRVVEDLRALSLFGFKGYWFDELSRYFDRHIPSAALKDLEKITDATFAQEQRNNDLKSQIDRLKTKLSQGEAELDRLNAKRIEVEESRAGLDAPFSI
ncbi:hypothetical protein SESBI_48583 [Sesbania bispinosa]|nr:hypothetical protein SESBI_48583 [Sesbania bispinosa]